METSQKKLGELRGNRGPATLSQASNDDHLYAKKNGRQADMTATPASYPQGRFKPKACRKCGTEFQPNAPSHLYCSDKCKDWAYTSNYLTKHYGIDYDQYMEMHVNQNGLCAICHEVGFKIEPRSRNLLVVDHCHTTGKVRGLLCHNCNRALGLLKDNSERLLRAVDYLEGATTIRKEYTQVSGSAQPLARDEKGDDIVCSARSNS